MKIRDQNVHPSAQVGRKEMTIALVVAINQAGVVAFKWTPGYRFEVVRVTTYCLTKVGAVAGNLKIATRVAAPLVLTAATEVVGVLSATKANVRGSPTEAITLEYTTDGTGALTNGMVLVTIRPRPQAGDLGPV
jgi:hypothetical protein